jgi:hypothetical protein
MLVLTARGEARTLGFGHALYEALVRGWPPVTASALSFELARLPPRSEAAAVADALLAARLEMPLAPEDLARRSF